LRGIEDLNVVGADIVEVSPAYDGATEATSLAAAQVAFEILTSIVKRGLEGSPAAGGSQDAAPRDEL
jgi:agmatinase